MNTKILGISGKKQSGKNTTANFIVGTWLKTLGVINDFILTDKGELYIGGLLDDSSYEGIFDVLDKSENMQKFLEVHLNSFVRVYSFAEPLKEMCINILGLSREQCYGTDEQKNSVTHLKWEDMPGVITKEILDEEGGNALCPIFSTDDTQTIQETLARVKLSYHNSGFMTARQVLQSWGTEIYRKAYNNVWVEATLRQIQKDKPLMAIITDARFINEIEGINNAGGKVLRLNRDIFNGQDVHESETALDSYPIANYLAVIDNDKMSINEQCQEVDRILTSIQWMPQC